MGRKTILFVTLTALILLLSSCQLAQEEQGKDTSEPPCGSLYHHKPPRPV